MSICLGEGKDKYRAMKGPCPDGYHVPTKEDFDTVLLDLQLLGLTRGVQIAVALYTYFRMPLTGYRTAQDGTVTDADSYGFYRTCNSIKCCPYYLQIDGSSNYTFTTPIETNFLGMCIRPFKNVPAIPDSTRTVERQGMGSAGIYSNATLGLISISSDGTNWKTMMDKNLGATTVFDYIEASIRTQDDCGYFYQRGNNYGFPYSGDLTTTTEQVDTSGYGPGNYYSSSNYIISSTFNNYSLDNTDDLRGGITGKSISSVKDIFLGEGTTDSVRRGPCPKGFHVPTRQELTSLVDTLTNLGLDTTSNGDSIKYLKMPFSGILYNTSSGNHGYSGSYGYYWACTNNIATTADYLKAESSSLSSPGALTVSSVNVNQGASIRPFKDTIVVPDNTWTTLYDGSGVAAGAGIFHNATEGIISFSSDGTSRITISDKNVGATTVYNDGDTLSQANCGTFFQRGNCHGFKWDGAAIISSLTYKVNDYGPGNNFSLWKFITGSNRWDKSSNGNLWGGFGTWAKKRGNIKRVFKGDTQIWGNIQPGVYHNPTLGLLSISPDGETRLTIADKNLGATSTNVNSSDSYGNYYQRGNNYGFPSSGFTTSTTRVDTSGYGPGNYYNSSTFIITSNNEDWSSNTNNNLWGFTTGGLLSKRGPCPEGYHIPDSYEKRILVKYLWCILGRDILKEDVQKLLLLPYSGYLGYNDGTISSVGTNGFMRLCDYYSSGNYTNGYLYGTNSANAGYSNSYNRRGTGYPIRPFKNEIVIPDNTWVKIDI